MFATFPTASSRPSAPPERFNPLAARRPFVVLDRDGTIIVERHYLSDPQEIELIPNVAASLRQLTKTGFGLVVITNQSGVGRGLFDMARLRLIHQQMCDLLNTEGVHLNGIYACPHTPEDQCLCRKPGTHLMEVAARELDFDPRASFVIGDKLCDIEMGRRAGATTFLVRTGYGANAAPATLRAADHVVEDLAQAAHLIERLLARRGRREADAPALPA